MNAVVIQLRPPTSDCGVRRRETACSGCGARAFSVCAGLPDADLSRLDALAETVRFAPGEVLVREGDPATRLFNLTAGTVRVFKLLPDGRRQIVGFLFAGDFLGLATEATYAFSAEAIEPTVACRFNRAAYQDLIDDSPALGRALLERARHELAAAQNQMLLLGRKTAQERIASFLLDLAERDPMRAHAPNALHLPMTRADMADYLGLTIETVSRTLTRLKTSGAIRMTSLSDLVVSDPRRLRDIAEGL